MKPETELRELDAWIAEHVMGMKAISQDGPKPTAGTEDDYFVREWIHVSESLPHYTTNPADAMAVMQACYLKETNNYFAAFHNFLMRKDHDRSFTPLQICLYAHQLFSA